MRLSRGDDLVWIDWGRGKWEKQEGVVCDSSEMLTDSCTKPKVSYDVGQLD